MRNIMRLGDVASYINGFPFKPSDWSDMGVPIIRIQDLTGNGYQMNRFDGKYDAKYEVRAGDVLISWSASLGVYVWKLETAVLNQHIFKVRFDKVDVDKDFFVYQVECLLKKAARQAHGATMRHLTKLVFDGLPFYLPPKEEQKRIAVQLNAITHLISLRQQQAEKLDELVKARFVEMFGDPVLNTRRLPSVSGTSLFKLSNGKAVPAEKRFDSGIPAYGGNGISWYTDEALINTDTLVVGRVGFQSGNVHFVYGPLWITDNAMYVTWYRKELICLRFLNQLMKRVDFSRYQDAGDLKKITQKPFMKFEYILPSMNLQMEFVNFMDSVNCEKERIQRSAALLKTLKRSLMQQYFG